MRYEQVEKHTFGHANENHILYRNVKRHSEMFIQFLRHLTNKNNSSIYIVLYMY